MEEGKVRREPGTLLEASSKLQDTMFTYLNLHSTLRYPKALWDYLIGAYDCQKI